MKTNKISNVWLEKTLQDLLTKLIDNRSNVISNFKKEIDNMYFIKSDYFGEDIENTIVKDEAIVCLKYLENTDNYVIICKDGEKKYATELTEIMYTIIKNQLDSLNIKEEDEIIRRVINYRCQITENHIYVENLTERLRESDLKNFKNIEIHGFYTDNENLIKILITTNSSELYKPALSIYSYNGELRLIYVDAFITMHYLSNNNSKLIDEVPYIKIDEDTVDQTIFLKLMEYEMI